MIREACFDQTQASGQNAWILPGTTNAVTDNASAVTPPAGWDIGNQPGSSWNANLPLAATTYGIAVSTTP